MLTLAHYCVAEAVQPFVRLHLPYSKKGYPLRAELLDHYGGLATYVADQKGRSRMRESRYIY